jgi:hypothetical protein
LRTNVGGEGGPPYSTLIAQSLEDLRIQTSSHEFLFGIGEADWDLDQDTGLITFTNSRNVQAIAEAQFVGTYNRVDGTWLWAWDNPSLEPALVAQVEITREYGLQHNIAELTVRKLRITEERCWEFTALANKLGRSQGAYRGTAGDTLVFLTFGEISLQMLDATD